MVTSNAEHSRAALPKPKRGHLIDTTSWLDYLMRKENHRSEVLPTSHGRRPYNIKLEEKEEAATHQIQFIEGMWRERERGRSREGP
jgi:hypothetical protein